MNSKNLIIALAVFASTLLLAFVADSYLDNSPQVAPPPIITPPSTQLPPQQPQPQVLLLEDALKEIKASDQKEWLYYLASPELDGRRPGTEGYRKAASYVEEHCTKWGLKTEQQRVPNRDYNVFAYIEGSDTSLKDEIIVVGAHLDHLGNRRLGADDNGSGSVLLMSVAKAFSKMKAPPRTIVFQWYTAEESGLIGSSYYVNNPTFPKNRPDIKKHVAMINADMVGRLSRDMLPRRVFAVFGVDLYSYVDELNSKYPFARKITQRGPGGSDHTPFLRKGIPSVFLHTGTHRDYHRVTDTADKINYEGMEQISKYACELAYKCCHAGRNAHKVTFTLYRDYSPRCDLGGDGWSQHP